MQNKTIDNALLALRQIGGHQGKLAEVLLEMRGVPLPYVYQFQPAKRGDTKRLCIAALQDGPKTTRQVGDILMMEKPDLSRREASHRAYMALLRLVDSGVAVRDGLLWVLAQ
jgi:hypothetical protein